MKKRIHFLSTFIIICTFSSCQKETEVEQNNGLMQFYAAYNGEFKTKGTSTFTSGNKVSIIGYTAGASTTTATAVSGTPVEATCGASGLLTPSTPIYLPKGTYDFYSVSLNSTSSPGISFISGSSAQLTNAIDYIWAKSSNISQGGTASFVYYHKAVGMEINIASGTGVSNLALTGISFTPTTPNITSKMALSDGTIGAASAVGSLTAMTITGSKGSYIMLPVGSVSINVEITVNATIGGTAVTSKKYTATIPSQAYQSGHYYTINFTISSTALQFTGAVVEDWTTQNISGVNLTEQ